MGTLQEIDPVTGQYKRPVDIQDGAGQYLRVPRLTTVQRNALTATYGMVIYNTTTDRFERYASPGVWKTFGVQTDHFEFNVSGLTGSNPIYVGTPGAFFQILLANAHLKFVYTSGLVTVYSAGNIVVDIYKNSVAPANHVFQVIIPVPAAGTWFASMSSVVITPGTDAFTPADIIIIGYTFPPAANLWSYIKVSWEYD